MATSLPISPYYPDMRPTLPYQATPSYNTAAPLTAPRGTRISKAGAWRPVQTTPVGPRDNMLTMPLFGTDVPRNTSGGFVPPTMTPAMYSTTGTPGRRLMADGFGTLPSSPIAPPQAPLPPTQVASVPLPQPRPATAGAGINFAGLRDAQAEYGVHDPAMTPQSPATAYAPQPPMNPAVASATDVAQGQPQTSWVEDMLTGLNSLLPGGSPQRPQTPQERYDAANFLSASQARNQDRSGIGTDGYVRNSLGVVTGLADWAQGLSPAEQYAMASNIGVDNSWMTTIDTGRSKQYPAVAWGGTSGGAPTPSMVAAPPRGPSGSSGGARPQPPVTAGPMAPQRMSLSQAVGQQQYRKGR